MDGPEQKRFSIFDSSGKFVCNVFNTHLSNVKWEMIPLVVPGSRYIAIVYADNFSVIETVETLCVKCVMTPEMVKMDGGGRIDNTYNGYSIVVKGFLPQGGHLMMDIEPDSGGKNSPLMAVVKLFETSGCQVFCKETGKRIWYFPSVKDWSVEVVKLGLEK